MTLQRQDATPPQLLDFHCPCCKRFLGRIDKTAPGLTWCAECKIEIATKPVAKVPTL